MPSLCPALIFSKWDLEPLARILDHVYPSQSPYPDSLLPFSSPHLLMPPFPSLVIFFKRDSNPKCEGLAILGTFLQFVGSLPSKV